jgi:DNA-binding XRE family transcriptional regulator
MKDLRTKLKLSQSIMAQLLDTGTPNLQAIEKGRRPLPKSQKANYHTLLSIASMPEWEKLEAECNEEEEVRNDYVMELAKELKNHRPRVMRPEPNRPHRRIVISDYVIGMLLLKSD